MNAQQRVWVWGLLITLIAATTMIATAALSNGPTIITIPIDTKTFGDPGSIHLLKTIPGSEFGELGWVCGVNVEGGNNRSAHDGNNMHVTSNGDSVTAPDFERTPFQTTPARGTFILGATVEILLELGTDGASSGGVVVVIECSPPPEDPTTTTTTTTTTEPPAATTTTTTPPPGPTTTTTEPPPVNGIDTGGGAMAHIISEGGSWSPGQTWMALGFVFLVVALFGALLIHGGNRRQDDE